MIEQCGYCNMVHDVGDMPETFGGALKTCPLVPPDQILYIKQLLHPSQLSPDIVGFFDTHNVIDCD